LKLLTALTLRLDGTLDYIHGLAGCEERVVLVDIIDAGNVFKGLHHTLLALPGRHTWLTHELINHIVEGVNIAGLNWRLIFHCEEVILT
jgi:hypothetical protein